MLNEQHIQQQITNHVQWIIKAKGYDEAVKLQPLLDKSNNLMMTAIQRFEDKEFEAAIKLLDKLLAANNHPYLFTQPWVVQAGIYGKDILRASGRKDECLLWVLYTLSVIMIHEPELRDADDLAELYMLLMDEMLNIQDAPVEIIRQKLLDMAWNGSGKRDSIFDGLSSLAMSHILLMSRDFDKAEAHFRIAEKELDEVDRDSLAWAMRCCVLAEIRANTGKFDESVDAARAAEDIYRARGRTAYMLSLSRRRAALLFMNSAWRQSSDAFMKAVEASDELYRLALTRTDQEERLSDNGELYRHGAYALARDKRPEEAVVLLEQGRARILGDGISQDFADIERIRKDYPDVHETYRQAVHNLREYEKHSSGEKTSELKENVRNARKKLDEAIEFIRKVSGYEQFLKNPTYEDIIAAVEPDHPIVYLATIEVGTIALVVYKKGQDKMPQVDILWEPFRELTSKWLGNLVGSISPASQAWLGKHEEYRQACLYPVRDRQGLRDRLMSVIDHTNNELWNVMGPVVNHLKSLGFTRAVLVPGGLLGLLPLHAASRVVGSSCSYALDDITFSYASSARTLLHSRRIVKSARADTLTAITNPTSNDRPLEYSADEVNYVSSLFKDNCTILKGESACSHNILGALFDAQVFHYSGHAYVNLSDSMSSGLGESGNPLLTARELLNMRIATISGKYRGRLAVLSACETGVVGTKLPDEVVGLSTAFVRMGFAGVVSSLWLADDESTCMLMKEFYDQWVKNGKRPDEALILAQRRVRGRDRFAHPYYWAGFFLMGV